MAPKRGARTSSKVTDLSRWRDCIDDAFFSQTPQAFAALRDFLLSSPNNIECVTAALTQLQASDIPPPGTDFDRTGSIDVAQAGLQDLAVIIKSLVTLLPHPGKSEEAKYKTGLVELLIESWTDVVKWLIFLLCAYAPTTAHPSKTIFDIAEFLTYTILLATTPREPTDAEKKDQAAAALKEELLYLPCTLDYLFLLLCQIDPLTRKYYYIPASDRRAMGSGCMLVRVFKAYVDSSPRALTNLIARLKAVKPATRCKILNSIILRAPQTADTAVKVAERVVQKAGRKDGEELGSKTVERAMAPLKEALENVYHLLFAISQMLIDPSLAAPFAKQNLLTEYAVTLSALCDKAHSLVREEEATPNPASNEMQFWKLLCGTLTWFVSTLILKRLRNPPHAVPSAIKGGILPCALRLLVHLDLEDRTTPMVIDDIIDPLLAFMPLRKVWSELKAGDGTKGDVKGKGVDAGDWEEVLREARRTSRGARMVCKEISGAFERGVEAYGTRRAEVEMCSNMHHPKPKKLGMFEKPAPVVLRTCGSCHSVQYCSEECQREDWVSFHRRECRRLAKWYGDAKAVGCWVTTNDRRDYLTYLEALANELLPPLPAINPARIDPKIKQLTSGVNSMSMSDSSSKKGQGDGTHKGAHYHPDTTLALFDFVTHEGLATKLKYPVQEYSEVCWERVDKHFAEGAMEGRVRAGMADVDRSWVDGVGSGGDGWCAVEGVFMFSKVVSVYVFARMRWEEGESVGRKWKVGPGSAVRLGSRNVMEDVRGPYNKDDED